MPGLTYRYLLRFFGVWLHLTDRPSTYLLLESCVVAYPGSRLNGPPEWKDVEPERNDIMVSHRKSVDLTTFESFLAG